MEGCGEGVDGIFDSPEEEESVAVSMGFYECDCDAAFTCGSIDGVVSRQDMAIGGAEVGSEVVEDGGSAVGGVCAVEVGTVVDLDADGFVAQEFQNEGFGFEGA